MLSGVMGTLQATEVLKLLLHKGKPLIGRLLVYDAMKLSFRELKLRRDESCALCGDQPTITELQDYEAFCAVPLATAEEDETSPDEIAPQQLKEWMDGEEPCSLVDVRELLEWEICHIDSAKLVPLSTFETAPDTLNPDDRIVLYCYKGKRSLQALEKLREAGFSKLHSLAGGIDRWAEEVDPEMPRY